MADPIVLEVPHDGAMVRLTIRARRGWSAYNRCESAKVSLDGTGKVVGVDLARYGLAVMDTAILSWSLDEPIRDPETGALNTAYVLSDDFDPDLGDAIVAAVDAHYRAGKASPEGKSNAAATSTLP